MDIRKFVTIKKPPRQQQSQSLLDRAAPERSVDVLCPEPVRLAAKRWIEEFRRRESGAQKKMLLVSGPSGVGKSTLLRLLLAEAGYHVHAITAQTPRQSVVDALWDMCPATTAILLDDVDVMLETSAAAVQDIVMHVYPLKGKRSVTRDQKDAMAASHWTFPVVATTKCHEYGKVVDFSKWCEIVPFPRPTVDRLAAHLKTVVARAKLPAMSVANLRAIAEASKRDVRNALMTLDLSRGKALVPTSVKDNDIDAVNAVHMLIHTDAPLSMATALRLAHADTSIVPMMLFENYLDVATSIEKAADAADAMAFANVIEDRMYATGNFEMLDSYFGFSVASPSLAVRAKKNALPVRFGNMWSRISNMHVKKAGMNAIRDALVPVTGTWAGYDVIRTMRDVYERAMPDAGALAAAGADPATFVKICRFGLTPPRMSLVSMQTIQKRLVQYLEKKAQEEVSSLP